MTTDASNRLRDRIRAVQGAHNLRDLGGLSGVDGATVRLGRIFRSDYPGFADLAGGTPVRALGLRSVIDLRRGSEAEAECVVWADHGVTYSRWPFSAGKADSWHARYSSYLTNRPETVVGAVRQAMRTADHPVLFHCAAGKDRTGVLAALLLSTLGVSQDDIVADYELSAPAVEAILARLVEQQVYAEMLADSSVEDQQPLGGHMRALLSWLAERGGAERWLLDHGIEQMEVDRFRGEMLGE